MQAGCSARRCKPRVRVCGARPTIPCYLPAIYGAHDWSVSADKKTAGNRPGLLGRIFRVVQDHGEEFEIFVYSHLLHVPCLYSSRTVLRVIRRGRSFVVRDGAGLGTQVHSYTARQQWGARTASGVTNALSARSCSADVHALPGQALEWMNGRETVRKRCRCCVFFSCLVLRIT